MILIGSHPNPWLHLEYWPHCHQFPHFTLFCVDVSEERSCYVIDSDFSFKQSCCETQFSGIKSEEQKFLLANVSGVRENKMKIFQDILFSYLYPFRSVKDMKGTGWGIFYGLSHVFMAGDSD